MRMVFMGTPDFAATVLHSLVAAGHEVAAVITQPDKPCGRGKKLEKPAVKVLAESLGLPVYQPAKAKDGELYHILAEIAPEVIVVAAYGKILPQDILDLPKYGCLNVHASLLSALRGAAPIQRAIINGEKTTGVTIMLMDIGMDTGKMLSKSEITINEGENSGELFVRLAKVGAALLAETLPRWVSGEIEPEAQDESLAGYAPPLTKEEELLIWQDTAAEIVRRVRGLAPAPCAYTFFRGERLKIGQCVAIELTAAARPGEIVAVTKKSLTVACGSGAVELQMLQPAGKKMQAAADFINGAKPQSGEILGETNG